MLNEEDLIKFKEILYVDSTKEHIEKRKKMFRKIDGNGNGRLSLSEVDKGIRDILKFKDVYQMKQVISRAFDAAKDSVTNKNSKKGSDDCIEIHEFKYFLSYLKKYFDYYEMFSTVNTDGDKHLTFDEFQEAVPQFKKWGIKITDPKKTFNEIDLDKGGKIYFDEFCHWAIKNNLDLNYKEDENISEDDDEPQVEEIQQTQPEKKELNSTSKNFHIKNLEERIKILEVKNKNNLLKILV